MISSELPEVLGMADRILVCTRAGSPARSPTWPGDAGTDPAAGGGVDTGRRRSPGCARCRVLADYGMVLVLLLLVRRTSACATLAEQQPDGARSRRGAGSPDMVRQCRHGCKVGRRCRHTAGQDAAVRRRC